ncbi:MAG TPA: hypothetical protein VJO13_20125 [Ktedonobacterales bacterium]|nr:hypothetical protein [Ktedonobacterales bacterium]
MRLSHLWDSRRLLSCCLIIAGAIALALSGCAVLAATNEASSATATSTSAPTATPTPQPPCTQLVAGATPLQSVSGVPGLQAPAGSYISPASTSGGGAGQYTVTTYTLCFQGNEASIDGGQLTPSATPTSTIGHLVHDGWKLNNLFPDPTNFAYLDYCSNAHICVNSSGSGAPFTFVGFNQYASHTGGYTTVQLQVGRIAAPSCLNDPQYYSGTPKYTIYEDGNTASSSSPTYHFLMPPGARVSTYLGGGTAGSSYAYFCSAGTQATIVSFLKQAMQNGGYAISSVTASGFHAETGSNPTYSIDVSVSSPGNYYLRVFVPI